MIKKLIYAVAVALLLAAGHAYAQNNLNNPTQLNNLNLSSPFQQGTWVPVLSGALTTGAFTYSTQTGSYEIVGRMVSARFSIIMSAITTTIGGALQIAGLPIAANSSTGDYGACNINVFQGVTLDTSYGQLAGIITPGTAVIGIIESGSGQPALLLGSKGGIGGGQVITSTPQQIIGDCNYRT